MGLPITQDDIAALSIEERIELAQRLREGIEEGAVSLELSDEWKQELERRSAAHDANPGEAIPWEVVKARTLARLKR